MLWASFWSCMSRKVSPAFRCRVESAQISHISPAVTIASASNGCVCSSTTWLGARDERVAAWSKPLFDAFVAGAWLLHWTEDTLYWAAKPAVHLETDVTPPPVTPAPSV